MGVHARTAGFALIAVLVCAILLAVMTGSVLAIADTGLHEARTEAEMLRLTNVADAAINAVLLDTLSGDPARRPSANGAAFARDISGFSVSLKMTDEAGKIDINFAPRPVLVKLLLAAGLDSQVAAVEADRILDWREPGDVRRPNGAKMADYAGAGYPYGPRGGPFHSVGEISLVMGLETLDLARIENALTIYSRQSDVDSRLASADTQRLLGLPAQGVTDAAAGPLGGRVVTVEARVQHGPFVMNRKAVVRMTGNVARPVWVYRWE